MTGSPVVGVGTVGRLGVTPLKGAAHTHPDRVMVHRLEVHDDRRWALTEVRSDRLRIVRTVDSPMMTAVRAHSDATGGLLVDLPDGQRFSVRRPDGPRIAAEYWGRITQVCPAPGPWDQAFSDLLGRAVQLVAVCCPGGVVYADPVSLETTTSSLLEMARRAGVPAVDDERFRATIVVDAPALAPFGEANWVGRRIRVARLELLVRRQLARCTVVRFEPGTGRIGGPDPLRLLAADRRVGADIVFGVGADVLAPGEVRVGDPVSCPGRVGDTRI